MNSYDINEILADIKSDRKKKVILDTDAFNEADDQYAISYTILSQDKLDVVGFTAAPFHNDKCTGPGDGMLKSWQEIIHVTELAVGNHDIPILKGSNNFLKDEFTYEESEAADFIIEQAKKSDERIYVMAIGAITNVASALLKCPEISEKIVVAWLGTNVGNEHQIGEFNSTQGKAATRALFHSNVPIVLLPVIGFTWVLNLTGEDYATRVNGKNDLCNYLYKIVVKDMGRADFPFKGLVDVACVAAFVLPDSMDYTISNTPRVVAERTLNYDEERHKMLTACNIKPDVIFDDMFKKLWSAKGVQK